MAGFADLARSLVAVAHQLTATLQANVTHYKYSEATVDDSGKVTWGSGTVRTALLDNVNSMQRNQQGQLVMAQTKVTFLHPVVIDSRDKIVLPDGKTAEIVRISGFVDPDAVGSTSAYVTEIYLGTSGGSGW